MALLLLCRGSANALLLLCCCGPRESSDVQPSEVQAKEFKTSEDLSSDFVAVLSKSSESKLL